MGRSKTDAWKPYFLAAVGTLVLAWLYIKIFYGFDFSDESQYVVQLLGLLTTDQLFQVDLFFQQTCYLLIAPLVKLYYGNAESEVFGLLLAGRVIFAALLVVIVATVTFFGRVISNSTENLSVFFALSIISVIEYMPTFPNYNNTNFLLLYFAIGTWLFSTSIRGVILSGLCLGVAATIHPVTAFVTVIIMTFFYFREGERSKIVILAMSSLAAFIFIIGYALATEKFSINDLLLSLEFSAYFANIESPFKDILWVIYGVYGISCIATVVLLNYRLRSNLVLYINTVSPKILPIGCVAFCLFAVVLSFAPWVWRFAPMALFAAFVLYWIDREPSHENDHLLEKILLSGVGISLLYANTSGNEVLVFYRGFLLLLPFIFLVGSNLFPDKASIKVCALGLIVFLFANSLAHPYRDVHFWDASQKVSESSILHGVRVSDIKYRSLVEVGDIFQTNPVSGSTLVIGPQPWLYLMDDIHPATDMSYMHFTGRDDARLILADRLAVKEFEHLILASNEIPAVLLDAASAYIRDNQFYCTEYATSENLDTLLGRETAHDFPSLLTHCSRTLILPQQTP